MEVLIQTIPHTRWFKSWSMQEYPGNIWTT